MSSHNHKQQMMTRSDIRSQEAAGGGRRQVGLGLKAGMAIVLALVLLGALGASPALAQDAKKGADKSGQDSQAILEALIKRQAAIQGRTATGRTIQEAPPFKVRSRLDDLEFFPCDDCHDPGQSDRRVRELKEEHTEIVFEHGGGRFWCYDACHNAPDMTKLQQMWGKPVSFDEAYKLCGQCHFNRQKDWYFGGHGKRVGAFPAQREIPEEYGELLVKDREEIGTWNGERELLNCTACHNPHSPSIKPYKASPAPRVRAGLEWSVKPETPHKKIWDHLAEDQH